MQGRESRIKQGALAVEALDVAQEACAKVGKRASRQAYYIGRLLAREQMCLGDYETAFRLLLPIAGMPQICLPYSDTLQPSGIKEDPVFEACHQACQPAKVGRVASKYTSVVHRFPCYETRLAILR